MFDLQGDKGEKLGIVKLFLTHRMRLKEREEEDEEDMTHEN